MRFHIYGLRFMCGDNFCNLWTIAKLFCVGARDIYHLYIYIHICNDNLCAVGITKYIVASEQSERSSYQQSFMGRLVVIQTTLKSLKKSKKIEIYFYDHFIYILYIFMHGYDLLTRFSVRIFDRSRYSDWYKIIMVNIVFVNSTI